MRAVTIPKQGYGRGEKCVQCRLVMRPGDCGFVHRVNMAPGTYKRNVRTKFYSSSYELWFHRRCLEELMLEAPLDAGDYVTQFEELKEKAKAGDLF